MVLLVVTMVVVSHMIIHKQVRKRFVLCCVVVGVGNEMNINWVEFWREKKTREEEEEGKRRV